MQYRLRLLNARPEDEALCGPRTLLHHPSAPHQGQLTMSFIAGHMTVCQSEALLLACSCLDLFRPCF